VTPVCYPDGSGRGVRRQPPIRRPTELDRSELALEEKHKFQFLCITNSQSKESQMLLEQMISFSVNFYQAKVLERKKKSFHSIECWCVGNSHISVWEWPTWHIPLESHSV